MTSYSTPARVRFPRSADTGVVPVNLAPGSFAVNWADRKIYVGDAAGQPIVFSQWLQEWSPVRAYRTGDIVLRNDEQYRATRDLSPGTAFSLADWRAITGGGRVRFSETFATSIVSGGAVTIAADPTKVNVAAGTGVAITGSPAAPVGADVSWGATALSVSGSPGEWRVVAVSAAGVISVTDAATRTAAWRRQNILLAHVLTDHTGAAVQIVDGAFPAGGTAETLRDMYLSGGGAFRAAGLRCTVTPVMGLSRSEGMVFDIGGNWRANPDSPNLITLPDDPVVSMQYASRDRLRGAATSTIQTAQYDNGGASLTAVPPGSFTIQYVSMAPTGKVFVQYGHRVYGSLAAALSAVEDDWTDLPSFTAGWGNIVMAAMVVPSGATQPEAVTVLTAANTGDPFRSSVSGDTSQYMLIDGGRPMIGDLDMGGNSVLNADIDGGTF